MRLFALHIHGCDSPWDMAHPREIELYEMLSLVLKNQEKIMIDTKAILAAVAEERTENASLRALVVAQNKVISDTASQLKDALAANDPAALAQVQTDLDQAAADLSTDNAATKDAIAANTPPAAAPAG